MERARAARPRRSGVFESPAQVYALLFGASSLVLVFAVGMMGLLLARDKFHQTARLLFWIVTFGWLATFLALVHYRAGKG